MKTIATFNALHLGDNLVHLHFLRALAKKYPEIHFTHGAPDTHLLQLYPLWQDLANLTVQSIGLTTQGAINAWRGGDGHWYHHPHRLDFAAYHLDWFRHLASQMGLESPFAKAEDLLFDYPALRRDEDRGQMTDQTSPAADILVINSPPRSGQWSGYGPAAFDRLIADLRVAGHVVAHTFPSLDGNFCTWDRKMDVTAIGRLSQTAKCIIGCVTGPMWPCLNIWNAARPLRIHLLDTERVEFCPNTVHANSLSLVPEILKDHGIL